MKTFKKIHESKKVANIHIAKIKERGGTVKETIKNGKVLLEYSFNNIFIGYRAKSSNEKGKYGTFYTFKNQKYRETIKKEIQFKNPLILLNKDVEQFEGLPLEALIYKWFPDYDLKSSANKLNIETGELIDKKITMEAVKKGYDAIIMGDLEFVDLRNM